MKTITETKTIEEVKGYEAIDGTFFKDIKECEKYEETAKCIITSRIKQYLILETTEYSLFERGCDDCDVQIFNVPDEKAFNNICIYIKSFERLNWSGEITLPSEDKYIGKTIVVVWNYDHDWCEIGTIDEHLEKIKHNYEVCLKAKVMEV